MKYIIWTFDFEKASLKFTNKINYLIQRYGEEIIDFLEKSQNKYEVGFKNGKWYSLKNANRLTNKKYRLKEPRYEI